MQLGHRSVRIRHVLEYLGDHRRAHLGVLKREGFNPTVDHATATVVREALREPLDADTRPARRP